MSWKPLSDLGTSRRSNGRALGLLRLGPAVAMCLALALVGCGAANVTPVPTPPQETARAATFTTEDGVTITARLFGQGERGVVLAHMFPSDQTSWWEFAEVLAGRGYMALTLDFRGFGESGGDKKIDLIDLDLEAALKFLEDEGASTVFLVGASMGGTASLKVATRQGARAAAVVALSAPVNFNGLDLTSERVLLPVLLMATEGDGSAKNSLNFMIDNGVVGDRSETVLYPEGNDHGSNILDGVNGDAARLKILDFLKAH